MLQAINGNQFLYKTKITSLDLPELTTIRGRIILQDCQFLQYYSLPKLQYAREIAYSWPLISYLYLPNLEIGVEIANNCPNLTTISLPKFYSTSGTFSYIGANSPNIVSVYFRSPNMQSVTSDFLGDLSNPDLKIFVPTSLVTYYQNLGGFSSRASQIYPFDDWKD